MNETSQKDPTWKRDELILALDLYFRKHGSPNKNDSDVLEVSRLLRKLPIHPATIRTDKFRSPNSVAMKCMNFQRFDPSKKGGLPRGAKIEEEIWNEFVNDKFKLRELAEGLKNVTGSSVEMEAASKVLVSEEEDSAKEGETFLRMHLVRERNKTLVDRKKKSVLAEKGKLECEVCGFDFVGIYGELGDGFIECHHTKPVSNLRSGDRTKISDLALICSNCHRMIHRGGLIALDELRKIISTASSGHPEEPHTNP